VIKLMTNLRRRPPEFMTSRCIDLRDHVRLKRYEVMEMQAFAATLSPRLPVHRRIDPVAQ